MQTFRLFVSSPGDVMVERLRVENVVSRLNGEFAGVARLQAIRWEAEYYQAFSTFQKQIPPAADCDLVIGILKWRLGTELPPDFGETLPGDRPYPSGTAYEILTAMQKRQSGASLPDIYVFRFIGGSPPVQLDDPNRATIERNWQTLKGFFQEWFVTERGHFKAAFNQYSSEDDFEAQLEKLLRKWVADKVAGGRVVRWPIAIKGSPFCGLAAFGAKHAPVFFGRGDDITRAVDLWREAAGRGAPYLLLLGASGAGKSSLARAGLIPRLTTPGVIKEVDAWRVAVMRPGDSPAGPLLALAAALMQGEDTLPRPEEGRGAALPELAQGDSKTPAELAGVLRHGDEAAIKPVLNALARVGAAEQAREHYQRAVRCDLVLLIDQFEELFAAPVNDAERGTFIELISRLVGSGRVWLVATLRADFYASMLDQPLLKTLKEHGATYDLTAPGPVELAEIVRGPAEAAGLVFEADPATGERLDARLLRDAERADVLPLVQLALSRLYEARESVAGDIVLPINVYNGLGGLKGIVNEAGEGALGSLNEAERTCLPRLLRQLAVHSHGAQGEKLTIRAVPLDQAASDDSARKLIAALVGARLLTTSGSEADAQVRLAHQRVLEDWERARLIVTESADFYRIRAALEQRQAEWETGKRRRELLLARGLPLAEAATLVAKYRDELSTEVLDYVRASRRRAQRVQMVGWGVAAVFFLLAIAAGVTAKIASDERGRANRNFTAAKEAIDDLIFNVADGLRNVGGMRIESIRKILGTVQETLDHLVQTAPGDRELLRSRSVMLSSFVDTYLAAGDLKDAATAAAESLEIARRLAAQEQGNVRAQRDLLQSLGEVGDVKMQQGDLPGALAAYQESLDIGRRLATRDRSEPRDQVNVLLSLGEVGDVKLKEGDLAEALAAYQESLDIARRLAAPDQGNTEARRNLATSLSRVGNAKLQQGDLAGALAAYQESLDIHRSRAAQDQGNTQAQRDVSVTLLKVGDVKLQQGDVAGALAAYQEGLGIFRSLAAQDQGNARVQRDVSVGLNKVGDVKLQQGDLAEALAAYQESLDIARRLAAQDQGNAQAQRDVSLGLDEVGDIKLQQGDLAGALAAYRESLDIRRKLAAQDQSNAEAGRDVSVSLNRLGDVKVEQGDWTGALAAYQESLNIFRKLAAQEGNAQAQRDLSVSLNRVGGVKHQQGDVAGAHAAYQEGLDIARKLAARDQGDVQAQTNLASSLYNLSTVAEPAQARPLLTEALSILEKLEAEHKLTADDRDWPDLVRAALAKLP